MHQEYQYLNVMKNILQNGKIHKNRTGIDTLRILGETMRFDLSEEFPLLTTKKVYWKGVVHELLWFISGSSNIDYLVKNNVHIWDANAKDFYKKRMIEWGNSVEWGFICDKPKEGDLGPVYGCQWRNFNNQGFDQLSWAIDQIKNNPESRRIIVTAWNPLEIRNMALPPCHSFFQFNVDGDILNCTMYQRSCDIGLGIPMNIASYSLLTCMVAHVCGLKPGIFWHVMNDVHIYVDHIDSLKEQLSREPYSFPKIKINPEIKNIDDFKFEDIELIGYKSHPSIKMKMSV